MTRFMFLAFCSVLAACGSSGIAFQSALLGDVQIGDSRFRVYMQPGGGAAEARRLSFEALPSLVLTLEKGFRAIEVATGCQIVPGSLRGDQAIVLAKVDCP